MLAMSSAYRLDTGRNLFEAVLAAERSDGSRIVVSGEHWTAFVPHAAHWPYEVHVYPHRRVPDLQGLTGAERDEFCALYLDLLRGFDRLFDTPAPYVSAWHQAPVRAGRQEFGLHLELFTIRRAPGKLKYLAGSESGMGAFANDVAPETAAATLREKTSWRGAAPPGPRSRGEPEGRGAAWTEERGTSDEGRRCLKGAPQASGNRERATREGGASRAPRKRAGDTA
jgi:UDPglucose--hexose-1-phosphate uridylyltransferase